jgi:hypothetical protein
MANNREVSPESVFHLAEKRPPYISIMQTERTVIGYGITEDELEHVGTLNTQATTFFSVFIGLLTFAFGLVANWLIAGQPAGNGEILTKIGSPICFVLSLVFLFLAVQSFKTRSTILNRIKDQSKVIESG